jgi:hypothetical protein
MMSFFFNPWTMAVGAGLVSAPILIHLINRMRFRRVKWAAMEFLLKAQKKMRRKKILEQLLLLLLRMALVFLIGVLFARFLGFDPLQGKETRPTLHVVVLDDTPSMSDIGQAGESTGDAFSEAKKLITEKILPAAAQATTPQRVRVIRLSDQADLVNPDPNKEPELVNASSIERVRNALAGEKPSLVRVSLIAGLAKAQELLNRAPPDTAKVVHVVSDLRSVDWSEDAEGISQAIKDMTDSSGAKVHLVDVASPYRKADRKTPAFSDNVAIIELRPKNKVAAQNRPVEFEIRIKNFGNTDLKDVEVQFFRNGEGNVIPTLPIATLPANQEYRGVFQVSFPQIATKEDPLARFNIVTALLTKIGSDALASDNLRHAVVEVKEKLSVLFVVNSDDKPDDPKGDSFFLRRLFDTRFAAIEVVTGGVEALEKSDLREYSSIYLLDVPELKKDQAERLERYVQGGGGVGVFLGPKVLADAYNDQLYRGGSGFFPVPLPKSGFTQPLPDEIRIARRDLFAKRILIREEAAKSHPAVSGVYLEGPGKPSKDAATIERSLYLPRIEQHWPIARIGKWRDDHSVQEIYCLPNERPMHEFEASAVSAIDAIKSKYSEPKFEKFRATVDPILKQIREVSSQNLPLTKLADPLDRLLADQINEGDATEALLREFWSQPELAEARKQCQALRDSCKYGDPLYFAKRFGGGRVSVMTIPVGSPWSDWPIFQNCWVPVVAEMQKYLSGGGSEENRSVGSPFTASFEGGRYKPTASWVFLSTETPKTGTTPQKLEIVREPKVGAEPGVVPLDAKDGALKLNFLDARRPGAYIFTLTWQKRDGDPASAPSEKPEYLVDAFNVDAAREGNLQRTNADEFKSTAKGAELHSVEDQTWLETLKQKQTDLSSGRWIYLLILIVLVFEQAMAVRLSYHTQSENLEAFAPSAAAVFSRGGPQAAAPRETESDGPSLEEAASMAANDGERFG